MNAVQFTRAAERCGLGMKGISLGVVTLLESLELAPEPLRTAHNKCGQPATPSSKPGAMGPAISRGLVRRDRKQGEQGAYVITTEGRQYLLELRAKGLIADRKEEAAD